MRWKFSISHIANTAGQTLVEVLIAILIVTLVLTTLVVAVLLALKSARFSQHKSRAAFLGQEAVEWLRSQRQELGWGDFLDYASPAGVTYCLYSLDFSNQGECDNPVTEWIDAIYARSLVLTEVDPVSISAEVMVAWFEGDKQFTSPVSVTFTDWDLQN